MCTQYTYINKQEHQCYQPRENNSVRMTTLKVRSYSSGMKSHVKNAHSVHFGGYIRYILSASSFHFQKLSGEIRKKVICPKIRKILCITREPSVYGP